MKKIGLRQGYFFTTGKRVAQYYIVETGLKPGEKIVYEGLQSIKEGIADYSSINLSVG
jgi:hypothetical protein